MSRELSSLLLAIALTGVSGCGGSTPGTAGGTPGKLSFGDEVTSDIRIAVYGGPPGSSQPIGFGDTSSDGSFTLYQPGATGPLFLEAGDYVFTLESLGPPVQFPHAYTNVRTTPLKVRWSEDMPSLELHAPKELLAP